MVKTISVTDAKRRLSRLLQYIEQGDSYIVTSYERPIAKISAISEVKKPAVFARDMLLDRLRNQSVVSVGCWTRGELYENIW